VPSRTRKDTCTRCESDSEIASKSRAGHTRRQNIGPGPPRRVGGLLLPHGGVRQLLAPIHRPHAASEGCRELFHGALGRLRPVCLRGDPDRVPHFTLSSSSERQVSTQAGQRNSTNAMGAHVRAFSRGAARAGRPSWSIWAAAAARRRTSRLARYGRSRAHHPRYQYYNPRCLCRGNSPAAHRPRRQVLSIFAVRFGCSHRRGRAFS
jgi:hypothetical protein